MTNALGTQDRTGSLETLGNTLPNSPTCMLHHKLIKIFDNIQIMLWGWRWRLEEALSEGDRIRCMSLYMGRNSFNFLERRSYVTLAKLMGYNST